MHILGCWNTIQILMSWYNKVSIYRTLWLKNEKGDQNSDDRTVYGEEGRRKEMSENNIIVRKRMIIWGNVQGCGFRRRMRDAAEQVGTAGWVRNNPGSSVTVEIQGTEEAIEKTLELVEHSNNLIKIKKIDTVDIPVDVGDSGFGIYS